MNLVHRLQVLSIISNIVHTCRHMYEEVQVTEGMQYTP